MEVLTFGTSGTIETTGTQSLGKRLERSNAVERLERFERASVLFGARHRLSLCQSFLSNLTLNFEQA
jgi:hypothetical protein